MRALDGYIVYHNGEKIRYIYFVSNHPPRFPPPLSRLVIHQPEDRSHRLELDFTLRQKLDRSPWTLNFNRLRGTSDQILKRSTKRLIGLLIVVLDFLELAISIYHTTGRRKATTATPRPWKAKKRMKYARKFNICPFSSRSERFRCDLISSWGKLAIRRLRGSLSMGCSWSIQKSAWMVPPKNTNGDEHRDCFENI